jgi:FeS assembly protein SufD
MKIKMHSNNSDKIQLVFTDGKFNAEVSMLPQLPAGVILQSWAQVNNPRTKIAKALPEKVKKYLPAKSKGDGIFFYAPRNTKINIPIQVLFLNARKSNYRTSFLNNLIILEPDSQITWFEEYQTRGSSTHNYINTEIYLNDRATINYTKLQNESPTNQHSATLKVLQKKHSLAQINHINTGGNQVSDTIQVNLEQKEAKCLLTNLYLPSGKQEINQTVHIQHLHSHCQSQTLAKGILKGNATVNFKGRITVPQNSQYSEAQLLNKNLLLSNNAHVTTTPELEIYADNVKCNHGATVGQLDQKALTYLRTRGLNTRQARKLLIYAFANEIIERLPESIRKNIGNEINSFV